MFLYAGLFKKRANIPFAIKTGLTKWINWYFNI